MPAAASTPSPAPEIDRAVLGYTRDPDHGWLLRERQGLLYLRGGELAGYIGQRNGPFALHQPDLRPAVLAHAENAAATAGAAYFGLEAPTLNCHATDHLLARGFRIGRFTIALLSDAPFGQFDRYILTNPPFFL
ncbi:MAG TPA: hypothetical protein VNK95_24490 [Caldilineaceae bacterium]|nr:hypothetical protein [Caldilineaceae bacterium]